MSETFRDARRQIEARHEHHEQAPPMWAIVLAAGEGRRLAPLTQLLYGQEIPKQFAALDSEDTLLQSTVKRMACVVPWDRMVVVVGAHHAQIAQEQLASFAGIHIVHQPANVGTGPGMLLPLSYIKARDPKAKVIVTPSDHHIADGGRFVGALRAALRVSDSVPSGVTLLGAQPEAAVGDLGWIIPRGPEGRSGLVDRFVEKPAQSLAESLYAGGALWNTLILAGSVSSFWRLARTYLQDQTTNFEHYVDAMGTRAEKKVLRQIYKSMAPADFSRAVLERASGLGVVCLAGAGWNDCGTPERMLACLEGTPQLDSLLRRIHRALHASYSQRLQQAVA